MRYRHQKKMENIEIANAQNVNDPTQSIVAATSQVHTGKMTLISTTDQDADDNAITKTGDDKTSGLLSGDATTGNE